MGRTSGFRRIDWAPSRHCNEIKVTLMLKQLMRISLSLLIKFMCADDRSNMVVLMYYLRHVTSKKVFHGMVSCRMCCRYLV